MADLPLEHFDISQRRATILQRFYEARWILIALAVLFLFFLKHWPDGRTILLISYGIMCIVIAFNGRKSIHFSESMPVKSEVKRSRWPATQVKLFVNAIPEPSVVLDGDGIVRHTNQKMRDTFGPLAQGDPFTLKFRDPDFVEALLKIKQTGQSFSFPYHARFPAERHYLAHFSPITMPGKSKGNVLPDFIFVVMLDQTKQYRVEELRSDFIANVSHELRTPVSSLTGFIETLLGPAKNDEESRERFLHIMLEQAQRMGRLVNDLLSLSRIEMRSHVEPTEKVNLKEVLTHVIDAMTPLAKTANLSFDFSCNLSPSQGTKYDTEAPCILGDRDELIQLVQNLVDNACKYGVGGERVDISLNRVIAPADFNVKGDTCLCIEVRDYGKGIAVEHLPRLTERFYRVDAEESKRKMGTGLGLAVVKHIVMRHRAIMKIESIMEEGTTFRVYFSGIDY